jgi:hypothetical protein
VVATSYPEFAEALRRKLIIEIADLSPRRARAITPFQFTLNRIAPPDWLWALTIFLALHVYRSR